MRNNKIATTKNIVYATLIVFCGIFFCFINPEASNLLVLFIGCLLLVSCFYVALDVAAKMLTFINVLFSVRARVSIIFAIGLLVILRAIGQISVRDAVVIVLITSIGLFYINRFVGFKLDKEKA